MKKIILITSFFLITVSLILLATSINGEENNNIISDFHDSGDVEIYINIDSIIRESLSKDIFAALDALDFAFKELEDIDIQIDCIDFENLEIPDLHLDSLDIELDNLDIELDNLDIELDNLDVELDKFKDSLNTKGLVMVIKKGVLDSLNHNMKKMKIVISDKMKNMKDSLKSRMHKMKGELHKDIKIKCMQYKDFKNMTDDEIINSLKKDGVIENKSEVEIDRNGDKVIIKITKTKE